MGSGPIISSKPEATCVWASLALTLPCKGPLATSHGIGGNQVNPRLTPSLQVVRATYVYPPAAAVLVKSEKGRGSEREKKGDSGPARDRPHTGSDKKVPSTRSEQHTESVYVRVCVYETCMLLNINLRPHRGSDRVRAHLNSWSWWLIQQRPYTILHMRCLLSNLLHDVGISRLANLNRRQVVAVDCMHPRVSDRYTPAPLYQEFYSRLRLSTSVILLSYGVNSRIRTTSGTKCSPFFNYFFLIRPGLL